MKRTIYYLQARVLAILLLSIGTSINLHAQNCMDDNLPITSYSQSAYGSQYGWYLPALGTIRILVVLAEVNYDVNSDPNPYVTWQQGTFPTWGDNLFNASTPSNGLFTHYFELASSGNLQVEGDYLAPPLNGGVISVNESDIISQGVENALISAINSQMTSGFITRSGIINPAHFDMWTPNGYGIQKNNVPNISIDHVMIMWRNHTIPNGTGNASPNQLGIGTILGYSTDTWSQFGAQTNMPLDISRHEFAHLIVGGNNFHVSGGAEFNMWLSKNSAHAILSLSSAALNCWSAWDRNRLNWIAPGNSFSISARDMNNLYEISGDLDATVSGHAGIYTLRDFVTTGDAIRIKLPFTPSNKYQEYIWLENHNGSSMNGIQFDEYRSAIGNSCITPATYGLYAYMQIGKDNEVDNVYQNVFGDPSDYLRYISADGFFDTDIESATQTTSCWPPPIKPFFKIEENPLTGECDLDELSTDIVPPFDVLNYYDRYPKVYQNEQGVYLYNVFQAGNSRQVFTLNGVRKFGLGYNPSTSSMINLTSFDIQANNPKDQRIVYLNGVSIEIISQSSGNIQVQIRFDDVDIVSDQRWCAPEIHLNPIGPSNAYSLNLKTNKVIILDQGLTATKMTDPLLFHGRKVFSDPTSFYCKAGSFLNLEPGAEFVVDNNSQLILEPNSRIDIGQNAILRVKRGGRLVINTGAVINVNDGKIIIEDDGYVNYFPNCTVNLDGNVAVFEINGILKLEDNATLRLNRTTSNHGFFRFNNASLSPSRNVICGANCSIDISGASQSRKIIQIDQESLYIPSDIVFFNLNRGKVELNSNSRLQVEGITTNVSVTFSKFTSNVAGQNNNHRGLNLFGQSNCTVSSCIFEYGKYGIFAWQTLGGGSLTVIASVFRHNVFGIRVQDKGLNLFNCSYFNNQYGIYGGNMTHPSYFYQAVVGGTQVSSNENGIRWQGASTPVLTLDDPLINFNNIATRVDNCPLYIKCGTISWNQNGVVFNYGASLHMDDNVAIPHPANVTIENNYYSIRTVYGRYLYLFKGQNNLKPIQTGIGHSVFGLLMAPPYSINVDNNWWGAQGLSSAEYNLTDGVSNNYSLTGIVLSNASSCGQAFPPCGSPPCDMGDPLKYCPQCDLINTDDFINKPLNEATKEAIDKFNSQSQNKYTEAINLLIQILNENYNNPNNDEIYLLNYSYIKLMEALGFAYRSEDLVCNSDSLLISRIIDIIQNRISLANSQDDKYEKYVYSLDKAQVLWLACLRSESIELLNEMLSWAPDQDCIAVINSMICQINVEEAALLGAIDRALIEEELNSCSSSNYRISSSNITVQESESNQKNGAMHINIGPNPASDYLEINGGGDLYKVTLLNSTGQIVYSELDSYGSSIDLSYIANGLYSVVINDMVNNKIFTERIVIYK